MTTQTYTSPLTSGYEQAVASLRMKIRDLKKEHPDLKILNEHLTLDLVDGKWAHTWTLSVEFGEK